MNLFLIDATAFCYRAFYALKDLGTSFGQQTNAVYGFVVMLNKLLRQYQPEYLAACFDVSRDTFRQKKFAEYKSHRPPMPQGLVEQMPFIKEIISAYGIALFEKEGLEADDLIAALSRKAAANNMEVTVVSSDKDMLQLVNKKIRVVNPYASEAGPYDEKKVLERFGVAPSKIPDVIALMGDDADNIPGVDGIGEKTAVELLKEFGSLEKILSEPGRIKQPKLKEAVSQNIEMIKLNRQLAALEGTAELDFDLKALRRGRQDTRRLFKVFKYLEFKKFIKALQLEDDPGAGYEAAQIKDSQLPGMLEGCSELFISGEDSTEMVFLAGGRAFKLQQLGERTREVLLDLQIKKSGHDLKGIKVALGKQGIAVQGLGFDVMIAAHLIDPARGDYSPQALAQDYLERAVSSQLTNAAAVALAAELKPKLKSLLQERSLLELFEDVEMPVSDVLARMQLNGIRLDLKRLKGLSGEIEGKLIKLMEDIYGLSGSQFNINSPQQLREVLFERLKLPVIKKSKTGASTDEEVLRRLSRQHALPALLLQYRQLAKLKSTYIDTLPEMADEKTHKLHTCFNQTATETGRLSSRSPNLQNIPVKTDIGRKIRQAIVASGDNQCLLSCDYSQIELRILAHLSGDGNLIADFKEGRDIHRLTASLIYGIEEGSIEDSMREAAKRINFGIIYGLSAFGLSRDLGISLEEAQQFIDAYFLRYPKVKDYIDSQVQKAMQEGFVTTLLGRRRYLPQINSRNQAIRQFAQRQAVNTPIQGTAADLIKLAMIDIDKAIVAGGLSSQMVLQVHDELVFDAPEKESAELADLVKQRMENVLKLDVPIKVSMKKGRNWLDMEEI